MTEATIIWSFARYIKSRCSLNVMVAYQQNTGNTGYDYGLGAMLTVHQSIYVAKLIPF